MLPSHSLVRVCQDSVYFANCMILVGDHKFLVELACSTTLVPAYHPALFEKLVGPGEGKTVVFIVCGGFKVSIKDIVDYEAMIEESVSKRGSEKWKVIIDDGEIVELEKRPV